jgi:alpha-1,3-glucan synthase
MRRFPIDLYHINDYHGTVAPLYLLPDTIPVRILSVLDWLLIC